MPRYSDTMCPSAPYALLRSMMASSEILEPTVLCTGDAVAFGQLATCPPHIEQLATADGLKLRGDSVYGADGDRPFVLSRAFFSGTQ
eukprot:scaffold174600_cov32-Prasinocladus_malaysianus.AAC.1